MLLSPSHAQASLLSTLSDDSSEPHTALIILPHGQLIASATKYDGSASDPYHDEPERIRLLLGLASQWEEDNSPRVECELGRLLLCPIPLPPPESPSANAALPPYRTPPARIFVLLLNGSSQTPWSAMTAKAELVKDKLSS